jgi:hypothetical protein
MMKRRNTVRCNTTIHPRVPAKLCQGPVWAASCHRPYRLHAAITPATRAPGHWPLMQRAAQPLRNPCSACPPPPQVLPPLPPGHSYIAEAVPCLPPLPPPQVLPPLPPGHRVQPSPGGVCAAGLQPGAAGAVRAGAAGQGKGHVMRAGAGGEHCCRSCTHGRSSRAGARTRKEGRGGGEVGGGRARGHCCMEYSDRCTQQVRRRRQLLQELYARAQQGGAKDT